MTLEERLKDRQDRLVPGKVYAIQMDGYTFEGTYEGIDGQSIILRTGRKSDGNGTSKLFDRQELPLQVMKRAYSL